jgi:hypothetical protein
MPNARTTKGCNALHTSRACLGNPEAAELSGPSVSPHYVPEIKQIITDMQQQH